MRSITLLMLLPVLALAATAAAAGEAAFAAAPTVAKTSEGATIAFALAKPGDVEVAVLNAKGAVVRHLAAGVLGSLMLKREQAEQAAAHPPAEAKVPPGEPHSKV